MPRPPAARPSAPEPPLHSRTAQSAFLGARSPGRARSPRRRRPLAAPRSGERRAHPGSGSGLPARAARGVGAPACGRRAARREEGHGKRRMLSPVHVGVGAVPVTQWNCLRFAPRRSDINTLWRLLPGRCFPNGESSGSAERRAAAAKGQPAGHGGPAPRSGPRLAPSDTARTQLFNLLLP